MSELEGLRMGGADDHLLLTETIARLTQALVKTIPAGSVDGGTIATALVEMAAHAVAATFPDEEHGPVVEHLQNYLAHAVKRWDSDPLMRASIERTRRYGF